MKIGSTDKQPLAPAGGPDRKSTMPIKTDGSPAAVVPEASATVKLSASAKVLSAAEADPTFDTAKVDRIAQAIRDGKFEVNPDAIADKLIQNAQELLSRKSS